MYTTASSSAATLKSALLGLAGSRKVLRKKRTSLVGTEAPWLSCQIQCGFSALARMGKKQAIKSEKAKRRKIFFMERYRKGLRGHSLSILGESQRAASSFLAGS